MIEPTIVDTGPLVALLNRRERHYEWIRARIASSMPPILTCEAVLTEACFLIQENHSAIEALMELLRRKVLCVPFRFSEEQESIARLMKRYRNVPMSPADACFVRMSEQIANSRVLTFDRDFLIYRKNGRAVIPTMIPEDE